MAQRIHPMRALLWVVVLTALGSLVAAPLASAAKKKKAKPAGAVYTETNDPASNAVVVFNRDKNGKLTQRQIVKTGGKGSTQTVGCGPGCPILDSAGAVDMTPNGKLVFAVNAGSNTVTSFIETSTGLKRVASAPSGGQLPNSVTAYKGLLYVLNTNDGVISGLRYSATGQLTPIANSTKPIAGAGQNQVFPSGGARQIGFDYTGKQVVVSELATVVGGPPPGVISSFKVNADGTTGPAVSKGSASPLPFGFAFTGSNQLIVSEINDPMGQSNGSVSSYSFDTATGTPTGVSTETTGGVLPCWVSITGDGKHAFVINTGAGKPAGAAKFDIGSDGKLTSKGVTLAPSGTFAWTDPAVSSDSKYLYVAAPSVKGTKTSHIDQYKISGSGDLTFVGSTAKNLPTGLSGLDGR
jgi:6-phosphogluconolactonase (cycloisomerase 2 family)